MFNQCMNASNEDGFFDAFIGDNNISDIAEQTYIGSPIKPSVNIAGTETYYYDNTECGNAYAILYRSDLNPKFGYKVVPFTINYAKYNGVDYSDVYNAAYYLKNNKDVKDAYGLENDDLRAAFGGDMAQYYYHYMNYGKSKGRSADRDFSVLNYAAANPDVFEAYSEYESEESLISPIKTDFKAIAVHYLKYGKNEERQVKAKYNINDTPIIRQDVAKTLGINNISGWVNWYIKKGQYEN